MALSISKLSIAITANTKGLRKGLKSGRKQINAFGSKVAGAAAAVAKLSAATTALGGTGLALASRQAGRFEQSMARVRAITNASAQDFKRLEDQARDLGRTTEFTAKQSADAQTAFARAGFDTNKILEALPSTLQLASAGELAIAEAAEIAAGILGGFDLKTADLGRSLEVLVRASTTATTTVSELGEAFKVAAPIAEASGKSIEETAAVLGTFAEAQIRGAEAGTAFRNILLRLQIETSEVKKETDRLGISLFDQTGKLKNLADVIDTVNSATAGLTTKEKVRTAGILAGVKGSTAFIKLLSKGGDAIRKRQRVLEAEGDTLGRIARVQQDTLFGSFKRITSAMEGLGISIGRMVNKFIRPMAEQLAKAFNVIDDFFNKNADVIMILAGQVGEIGKEFLELFGVVSTGNAILDTLGFTGETALERLSNGLQVVSTLLNNTELAFDIFETTIKLALEASGSQAKFFFVDIMFRGLMNVVKFSRNVFKTLTTIGVTAFVKMSKAFLSLQKLLTFRISKSQFLADVQSLGAEFAVGIFDGLLDGVEDFPAERVVSEVEKKLAANLDKLGIEFGNELGKSIFEESKKATAEIPDPKIEAKVEVPGLDAVAAKIKQALSLPTALEFGTQAAITAERQIDDLGKTILDMSKLTDVQPEVDIDTKKAEKKIEVLASKLKTAVSSLTAFAFGEQVATTVDRGFSRIEKTLAGLANKAVEIGIEVDTKAAEIKLQDLLQKAAFELHTEIAMPPERDPVSDALKGAGLPGMKASTKASEAVEKNTAEMVVQNQNQLKVLETIADQLGDKAEIFSLL